MLTALALAATAHVLGALMHADDIVQGLRGNLSALLLLAGASAGRYLADAFARAAAARLAPKVTREADLKVITAATAAELVAYEDPDFDNAYAAAGDGAEKTRVLILDAQALTSALAQLVAAAAVASVLHPVLIPLLLLAVAPCAWGAVRAARIEHAAHHRNLSDTRLRAVFRNYSTERTTADEVRANTMAGFLIRQYRVVSGRLETEQLTASRRALVVQGVGDALSAAGML
ncbi:ABC transporter ATP-binding protein, partial [Streptomyces sp. NPDC095602]